MTCCPSFPSAICLVRGVLSAHLTFPLSLSLSLCNGHVVIMHLLGPVARWTSILSIDQHMRTLLEVLLRQQSSDRAICDVCEILRLCKNNGPVLSCFSSRKGGCE